MSFMYAVAKVLFLVLCTLCRARVFPTLFLMLMSQQASEGTITFKLVPAEGRLGVRESKVRVRAHFDYFAFSDPYIPCKEAGLDFRKGDILHIVSQDDAYW